MIDVYLITCVPNGKHYIGITSKGFEARWRKHEWDAMNDRSPRSAALHAAIRKYGPEAFRVELIEQCETWDQACAQERFWIQYIGTRPPFGYNLTDGGDGVVGPSDEVRQKISAARKGASRGPCSEQTRRRISIANKGKTRSDECRRKMTQRVYSSATRLKMAASRKGKTHSAATRQKMSESQKARRSLTSVQR